MMKKLSVKWKIMLPTYLIVFAFVISMGIQYFSLKNMKIQVDEMQDKYVLAITKADENVESEKNTSQAYADLEGSIGQIRSSISQLMVMAGIVILIACIMATIAFFTIIKLVIRPIEHIRDMATELRTGNLSITNDCTQKDEIGELSAEMNETASILNRYISDIGKYAQQIEKGNLRAELTEEFSGDFIVLKESLQNVELSLRDMMEQINHTSNGVADASGQAASGAQSLAHGSSEQAGSIEKLQNTISVTADHILEATRTAQVASEKANNIGTVLQTGTEQMREMTSAMDNISRSSTEIGKVIKAIEDIAFQTNILALNASVEAARAGEAGKGFAVVADEVRNLASKSADAASNTTSLIESSIHAVENGEDVVNATVESLKTVVAGVKEIVEITNSIAEGLLQQTTGIEDIQRGIAEISSVTQTISATAEENGAASEELSGQSEQLKRLVERFQL